MCGFFGLSFVCLFLFFVVFLVVLFWVVVVLFWGHFIDHFLLFLFCNVLV